MQKDKLKVQRRKYDLTRQPYWLLKGHARRSARRSGFDSSSRLGRSRPQTWFCGRCRRWETPPSPSAPQEAPPPASSPGLYTSQTADVTSCKDRSSQTLTSRQILGQTLPTLQLFPISPLACDISWIETFVCSDLILMSDPDQIRFGKTSNNRSISELSQKQTSDQFTFSVLLTSATRCQSDF